MHIVKNDKVDRAAYNDLYGATVSSYVDCKNQSEFIRRFEQEQLSPFGMGGITKGAARGMSISALIEDVKKQGDVNSSIQILDAGSGMGELSIYLGCLGYSVVGVDISEAACHSGQALAEHVGVTDRVRFLATSLECLDQIESESIGAIVGHASLHHFIKYDRVPDEFDRVLRPGGAGYFADSFGENRMFRLFHNKEQMRRLGDVILTKDLIDRYFGKFEVRLTPVDWFGMLDKFWLHVLPAKRHSLIRPMSRVHYVIDRHIPPNRFTLYLAGSVFTRIQKPK